MNQRKRKLMAVHKTLHTRDNADRLNVSTEEGGRGLNSNGDSVDTTMQRLDDYREKRRGTLITATKNNTDNTRTNKTEIIRKQKWQEKQLH